jgi:hypothetical protein
MVEQATCGQGLAEHSPLPAKLGELTASVAETLEVHMEALDLQDEDAKREHGVYMGLVQEHRHLAAQLQATGEKMAGYRDLPMGRHDLQVMSSPRAIRAFENFVTVERELLGLLRERVEHDQEMLAEMGGAAKE